MTALFDSLSLRCGVTLGNRIALAPLTNGQSHDDGTLGDDELRWLARRAQGGFSLIETCAAFVSADAKGFDGQLGVAIDAHDEGLARLARASRPAATDGVAIVQLYHGGARSGRVHTGLQPMSCVASGDPADPDSIRAMRDDEVERVIESFVSAAQRSQRAGFGGVEVHGAHGYLLCQFLSKHNTREGAWGGALDRRARIVREIVRGIRGRCGASFVIGVRLSPEDFGFAAGMDLDESVQCARWIAEDGADFVHLSLWDHQKPSQQRLGTDVIGLFRAAIDSEVAIVVAGKIWTPDEARSVLARGASMVALGRPAILNPSWPQLARDPAFVPVRGPLTVAQLRELAVSERFAVYLRRFKGIVAD